MVEKDEKSIQINYMIMRANTIHYCPKEKKTMLEKIQSQKLKIKNSLKGIRR